MVTFAEAKGHDARNIRKILELTVLVKPWEDDDTEITSIWGPTGLVVPPGYAPVGMTTKSDGLSWSRDMSTSDVESHGYTEPVRRDITSDTSGLNFTMQESRMAAMGLYHGIDLSATSTDADGNVFFDKASRPAQPYYRVLAIGKDGAGPDAIYNARWLPRAQVTEMGEQTWSEDNELAYPVTFSAYLDANFGTSMRELWGGPGLDHAAMGFEAPPSP